MSVLKCHCYILTVTGFLVDQVLDGVGVGGTEKAEAKLKFIGKVRVRCYVLFSSAGLCSAPYCLMYRGMSYAPFTGSNNCPENCFVLTLLYRGAQHTPFIGSTICPDNRFFRILIFKWYCPDNSVVCRNGEG